jgi:hypothetical protein
MNPVNSDSAWRPQVIWPAAWVKREKWSALGCALGIDPSHFTSGEAASQFTNGEAESRFTSGKAASHFTEVRP